VPDRREPFELLDAVNGDAADASRNRGLQLLIRLAGAVKRQPAGRNAGAFGSDQFADRADVESDRLPRKVPKKLDRRECFRGIRNLERRRRRRPQEPRDGGIDRFEIDDQQRRSVEARQFAGGYSTQLQFACGIAMDQNCSMNASICV
jgi:hypothetical protein